MKISVSNKEYEALKEIYQVYKERKGPRGGPLPESTALANIIRKYEQSLSRGKDRVSNSITIRELLDIARVILGNRLKEQLNPSALWYKQMQYRIDSRNISKGMATVALETIRDTWKGEVWVDTMINSLDKMAVMTPKNTSKSKLGWIKRVEGIDEPQEVE